MIRAHTPRLLLLDCDGVLIRSEGANLAFYNHLFDAFGLPRVAAEDSRALGLLHTLSTPQVIERFFPEELRGPAGVCAAGLSFEPFIAQLEAEPGWSLVLPRLARRMWIAVATNRGASAREVLRAVGLFEWFDLIVTIRDVPRPKPAPDLLEAALRHFGLQGSEALYVGDSELDRTAARAAGIPFVGFRTASPPSIQCPGELEVLLSGKAPRELPEGVYSCPERTPTEEKSA